MKINLKSNGFDKHGELFCKTVVNRIPVEFTDGGMTVCRSIKPSQAKRVF